MVTRLFKAYVFVLALLLVTFSLGILSRIYIKPELLKIGLSQHWPWPLICLCMALWSSKTKSIKIFIKPASFNSTCVFFIIGLFAGVGLQFLFFSFGLRKPFAFHNLAFSPLIYQITIVFSEEMLFRGVLQPYLARSSPMYGKILPSMVAALLISLPFGLIHGLNPILFGNGHFDIGWFLGTFFLSLTAGIVFSFIPFVISAFGVHIGFNLIM